MKVTIEISATTEAIILRTLQRVVDDAEKRGFSNTGGGGGSSGVDAPSVSFSITVERAPEPQLTDEELRRLRSILKAGNR